MASKPTGSFFDPLESPTQAPRPGGRRQPSNRTNRAQQTRGKKRRDSNGHDDNKTTVMGTKYSPYARPRRSKQLVVAWMVVFVFILVVTYYLNRRQRAGATSVVVEPLAEGILMHGDDDDLAGGRLGVSEALRNKVRPPKAPPVVGDEE